MALHHAQSGEVVHLASLSDSAGSTALVKTDQFEAIHLVVPSGTVLPAHSVAGQAILHCLRGKVGVSLGGETAIMSQGDWLYLERAQEHAVEGYEDAVVLLTILFT